MRSVSRKFLVAVFVLLGVYNIMPALAQDEPAGEVIVDGLRNPRNLSFDADGNLYIAEAGLAGEQRTVNDDSFGASSRITMVPYNAETSSYASPVVVVSGLLSNRTPETLGATAVQVTDESIWVLIGETSDFSIPYSHALLELDKETSRIKTYIDLLTVELEQDPDGNPNQQSNPTDFAIAPDGTIYIANAGCNCLLSWTPDTGVQVARAWPFDGDNPVPTSVEVDDNGDIYVGFLTGFPWPQGGARIEHWSGDELVETFTGLTMVTGLLLADDGALYAVEFTTLFDQASGYAAGRVVRVDANGITPVLENLTSPFGIAQAPNGTIVVSVTSTGVDAAGQVVVVPTN